MFLGVRRQCPEKAADWRVPLPHLSDALAAATRLSTQMLCWTALLGEWILGLV